MRTNKIRIGKLILYNCGIELWKNLYVVIQKIVAACLTSYSKDLLVINMQSIIFFFLSYFYYSRLHSTDPLNNGITSYHIRQTDA